MSALFEKKRKWYLSNNAMSSSGYGAINAPGITRKPWKWTSSERKSDSVFILLSNAQDSAVSQLQRPEMSFNTSQAIKIYLT